MVGSKGINLLGGQNTRVAPARALYLDADLFIFDCPLASADAIMWSDVFRKCLLELLRHKTIILATHNPEIISSEFVDRLWHVDAMSVTETDPAVSTRQQRVSKRTLRRSRAQLLDHSHLIEERSPFSLEVPKELLWSRDTGWTTPVIWGTLFLVYSSLGVAKNFWLVHWSNLNNPAYHAPEVNAMLHAATAYGSLIYGAFGVILSALQVLFYAIFSRSQTFFRIMTDSLLRAPTGFFYRTPIGEILLRYSSDMQSSDQFVSFHIMHLLRSLLSIVAAVGTICYLLGPLTGALIAVATVYVCREIVANRLIAQIFTVRDKLDTINLNFVSEALDGSAVTRAFGYTHVRRFRLQHGEMLDKRSRIAYAVEAFNDWSIIRYSLIVGVFLALVALFLATGSLTSTSALGLVLHCIFSIQLHLITFASGLFSATVHLTSIKNILDVQYIEPEEQQGHHDKSRAIGVNSSVVWPSRGEIVFDRVWFQYSTMTSDTLQHSEPPVFALRDVSFSVAGGEKVGVIGRTSKSSLAMTLFRVYETARGRILVSGVDICRLRLSDLRSRFCIIPQTPLFYRCLVRRYLDPFSEFDGAQLWQALSKIGLSGARDSPDNQGHHQQQHLYVKSLEKQLDENGENWSLGERQMLVLARALLKPSHILILDEEFSSVEQASDKFLLGVVEKEFAKSTVFLITHRLDQVLLGFDRIIVMQGGEVVEIGKAEELVANLDSAFYEFLETTLLTF